MEHVFVGAKMQLGSIMMPLETSTGVKRERQCQTVVVKGKLYQIDFHKGQYLGTDLATLEVVVLDME